MFRVFLNAGTGGYEEVVVIVGDELPRSSCPHILDSIKVGSFSEQLKDFFFSF